MLTLLAKPTAKNRVKKISAAIAAVAAASGLVLAGAPAATAAPAEYPTSSFSVGSGASYFSGTITWYNRSVGVAGTFKAVGCRRVYASAWAGGSELDERSSSTHCNSTTFETIPLAANVPGGAAWVDIIMTDQNGAYLDGETYWRP